MSADWSAWDGLLGVLLIVVLIWAGLKVMQRLVAGVLIVVLIGVIFFGMHWQDFLRPVEDLTR